MMFVSIPVRCNSNWWSSKAAKAGLSFNSSKVQFELSRVSARILVFFGFNSSKVQFEHVTDTNNPLTSMFQFQ